jgi:hypothetical protein
MMRERLNEFNFSPVNRGMNEIPFLYRLTAILFIASFSTGCMTTYDAYGRPVQSVDPALAVAGIAAAGIIG